MIYVDTRVWGALFRAVREMPSSTSRKLPIVLNRNPRAVKRDVDALAEVA